MLRRRAGGPSDPGWRRGPATCRRPGVARRLEPGTGRQQIAPGVRPAVRAEAGPEVTAVVDQIRRPVVGEPEPLVGLGVEGAALGQRAGLADLALHLLDDVPEVDD